MAPEQATADEAIDHRADIYAVGVMAYELLAGRPPFSESTPQQLLAAQVFEAPQPVTELRASVPPALETLVMRCLEKKPADRWQSAEEMLPHLEAAATPSGGITPTDLQSVTLPSAPIRRRSLTWMAGAFALVAFAVGYFAFFRGGEERVFPEEAVVESFPEDYVAVFPFRNLSGDPELDQLSSFTAYGITDGFSRTEEVGGVATNTVEQALAALGGGGSELEAAANLGTGTAVTGVITRQGDSIRLLAQITRVGSGEVFQSVDVSAAINQPTVAVETLRERVLGALAASLDETIFGVAIRRAPSYDAYQEYQRGLQIYVTRDYSGALPYFHRAFRLDSAFLRPLISAGASYSTLGRWAELDSLAGILESRRADLSPEEQLRLELFVASLAGDQDGAVRAYRALAQIDPVTHGDGLALYALRAGRPEEALRATERVDYNSPRSTGFVPVWYRLVHASQLTGRYEEALEAARQGQELFPEDLRLRSYEIRALIAMDRLSDVGPLLDTVEDMEPEADAWSPATVFRVVGRDLARSGHWEEARALAERSLDWSWPIGQRKHLHSSGR
jgi:serine/threonine-protein kinase